MRFSPFTVSKKLLLATLALVTVVTTAQPSLAQQAKPRFPELAYVKALDVNTFTAPLTNQTMVFPEVHNIIIEELKKRKFITYQSPADATLHLRCVMPHCYIIKAEIKRDPTGPVIWSGNTSRFRAGFPYYYRKDKRIAAKIVNQLSRDYQAAMAAAGSRIEP